MITGLLVGTTVVVALHIFTLWFDRIELNSKLRQLEREVDVLSSMILKMMEERKETKRSGDF